MGTRARISSHGKPMIAADWEESRKYKINRSETSFGKHRALPHKK